MDRALLVANEHMLHLVLLEKLVVDVENRTARIAEHVLDAFFLEAADDDFRIGQLHGFALSRIGEPRPGVTDAWDFPELLGAQSGWTRPQRLGSGRKPRLELPGRTPRDSPVTLVAPPEGAQSRSEEHTSALQS